MSRRRSGPRRDRERHQPGLLLRVMPSTTTAVGDRLHSIKSHSDSQMDNLGDIPWLSHQALHQKAAPAG
ncbi:MAG: hypothetical protein EA355_05850 [Rhodobacteraceae bacterium]|nr:MAG: hypothetical protein EA355_05850 [Paracoccaceae bacterium]